MLREQSQEYFEIDRDFQSASDWSAAILLLRSLDDFSLPSEKAALLVRVARCIYSTYEQEHPHQTRTMSADDFFPIFIYVLCNCELHDPYASRQLIHITMLHSVCVGEIGYYVTMYEAAVEYVASIIREDIEIDEKQIHTTTSIQEEPIDSEKSRRIRSNTWSVS